jgi:hypothetical protein
LSHFFVQLARVAIATVCSQRVTATLVSSQVRIVDPRGNYIQHNKKSKLLQR